MKNFRKISLFTGILFAFLFLGNQETEVVRQIQTELPGEYAAEGFHALAFLQPETTHHVISNTNTGFAVAKWLGFSETFPIDTGTKIRKSFFFQDIDRCETVSLLLFPFHIFW